MCLAVEPNYNPGSGVAVWTVPEYDKPGGEAGGAVGSNKTDTSYGKLK